jgi:putative ABC transport system permease protein
MADATRVWGYAVVGYPGMVVGFLLLAPLAIVLVERWAGPWVARLLGLPPRLLSSVLSAHPWRTLGTTVALTVGLGLYIATQTWGYSMLAPFTPGEWVPEMLVGFEPAGLPDDQIETVKNVKGILPDRFLPLAVEQPRLASDLTGVGSGNFSVVRQDNVVLIGLDPVVAFGGDRPMIDAAYVAGDRNSALEKLKAGSACLVPDHFLDASGLKLGDDLELIPPGAPPGKTVRYQIAGSVSLPGWHWMTKMTGLRRQTVRAGALVFAPIADVRRDFNITRTNFFWFDTDRTVTDPEVETAMQKIAEAHGEAKFRVGGVGEVTSRRPYARLTSAEAVRSGIRVRADGMIWGMSQIPLITLLITSLAVVNTVVASVRSRRWDLGILRAIGTTRGALVRLILAESILIGCVVCVLGVGFGLMAGWCGAGMSRYLSPFGGMSTPLVVPWSQLAFGAGASLLLCLIAALWPAVTTGREEPLSLLQGGRSAT